MRKLFALLFIVFILGCTQAQENLYYGNNTLEWDDELIDTDGIPYPSGAIITYEVVAYDKEVGISGVFQLGTSINTELAYLLDGYDRKVYICGVRSVYESQVSDYAWSNIPEDTVDGVAFGIVPGEEQAFILMKVKNFGIR